MIMPIGMNKATARHRRASLPIAAVCFLSMLLLAFPPVYATGTLVQQNSEHFIGVTSGGLAFTSPVTSGNVAVVAIADIIGGTNHLSTVTDSLGSAYTIAGPDCLADANVCAWIAYATIPSSAADTVTVTMNSARTLDVFIYEASGITISGATTGLGSSSTGSSSLSTPSTSFATQGFLVSLGKTFFSDTFTAGSGFTLSAEPAGAFYTDVQYSTSGVTSPTTFPMTISGSDNWVDIGVAFNISATSVPEFPVALAVPLVFLAAAAIYVAAKPRVIRR
jgi:hypothetical protein